MLDDFDRSIVESTAHRPWPLPRAPWVMTQSWHDLLFAHWRVGVSEVRRAVPAAFDLDLFDGEAWVGVVPFFMTNVGLRATPALPWFSAFAELNVRTYVRVADRPGVYFFSLDAARWLAVVAARMFLNLPYYAAEMSVQRVCDSVRYESVRRTREPAEFRAIYEPTGAPFVATPGSIEYFLTERYCLYHHNRRGHPYRLDIHHLPWSLQVARAEIIANSMAARHVALNGAPALLHCARRQDVVAWSPASLQATATRRFGQRSAVVPRMTTGSTTPSTNAAATFTHPQHAPSMAVLWATQVLAPPTVTRAQEFLPGDQGLAHDVPTAEHEHVKHEVHDLCLF